jgi:hypothetical protein
MSDPAVRARIREGMRRGVGAAGAANPESQGR